MGRPERSFSGSGRPPFAPGSGPPILTGALGRDGVDAGPAVGPIRMGGRAPVRAGALIDASAPVPAGGPILTGAAVG
jgi:hypothetical protein